MTWRDRLRPARLGNASFQVDTTSGQLGRNVQLHEYPLRDKPYVEDLGRKARRLTLECYVLAVAANRYDYMPARDALIAELETSGSKKLVHPYLGELTVNVVECDGPRETTREGGMARFTITVVESGEHVFPNAAADTRATARTKSGIALQASGSSFAEHFDVLNVADYISASAISFLSDFATTLSSILAQVTTNPLSLIRFSADLSTFLGSVSQSVLVPSTLCAQVQALFAQFESIARDSSSALTMTRALFTYGDDLPVPPSYGATTRLQQQANQAALVQLIQQAAVLTAVEVVAAMDFASADDALALRDELMDVFDVQTEKATDDAVYYALVDARTAMIADIEVRAAQLNKLITVTLPESASALVLAYELYKDANREAEIVARNHVRDPLFLPSGTAMEVLSNG